MDYTINHLTHTPNKNTHLRPILIAPVEDEERVGLAKEILFIQLVGTELHGGYVLEETTTPSINVFKLNTIYSLVDLALSIVASKKRYLPQAQKNTL